MSNEELALAIQKGDTGLTPQLWEQTERFITKAAWACYNRLGGLCAAAGVTVDIYARRDIWPSWKLYGPTMGGTSC